MSLRFHTHHKNTFNREDQEPRSGDAWFKCLVVQASHSRYLKGQREKIRLSRPTCVCYRVSSKPVYATWKCFNQPNQQTNNHIWHDGSTGKVLVATQTWQPEFNPWNPHGIEKNWLPQVSPDCHTCTVVCACSLHSQVHEKWLFKNLIILFWLWEVLVK